ncbi:hypothetical protein QV65_33350 [Rhodococcus erythropolis]|nr:hypothetical protein QV65_33350 [Rhodococcus erythropolis]
MKFRPTAHAAHSLTALVESARATARFGGASDALGGDAIPRRWMPVDAQARLRSGRPRSILHLLRCYVRQMRRRFVSASGGWARADGSICELIAHT